MTGGGLRIYTTRRYDRQFAKLSPIARAAIRRALRYLRQPDRIQPLSSNPDIYELRAGPWRVTWCYGEDATQILLRNCGEHDRVLRRP